MFFREFLFFVKNRALETLQDAQKTHRHGEILMHIETAYRNTKQSVDVQTPFFIGILKCIAQNDTVSMSQIENTSASKNTAPISSTKPPEKNIGVSSGQENTDSSAS